VDTNRIHSWHLFPLRLRQELLTISRNAFKEELQQEGVGTSVHWRPLHLHPYYRETFGWRPENFPVATSLWERSISLPIFSRMTDGQVDHVIDSVKRLCSRHRRGTEGSRNHAIAVKPQLAEAPIVAGADIQQVRPAPEQLLAECRLLLTGEASENR
jgi:hypothetical protein